MHKSAAITSAALRDVSDKEQSRGSSRQSRRKGRLEHVLALT
jgi:hypothetical protein